MDRKTKSYESEDGSPRKGNDPSNSAEDQALVNLITQTAKKSSYNNSKKDLTVKAEAPAPPPPKRSGCCGGVSDVAKPQAQEDEERGVLKDPQSSASYDVLGMVGEGGFSKVVLVRARAGHGANGEVYAAKIILRVVVARLLRRLREEVHEGLVLGAVRGVAAAPRRAVLGLVGLRLAVHPNTGPFARGRRRGNNAR